MEVSSNYPTDVSKATLGSAMLNGIWGSKWYRPLPKGFTKHPIDRAVMHVIEPTLRLAYYWPSRRFFNNKASNMVWWTRMVLNNLSRIHRPVFSYDPHIHATTQEWNGVSVRLYQPKRKPSTNGAVVFIHGGGFALGSVDMYDSLTRRIAKLLNSVVISIEYRLSPEAKFPAGLHDCEAAIEYFLDHAAEYGVDPARVILMGDSAGGNLTAVITHRRKLSNKKPSLKGQVLIYPLLHMADFQSPSYRYYHKNLEGYALVDPESVALYYLFYAGIDMDDEENRALLPYVLRNGHISEKNDKVIEELLKHRTEIESSLNYSSLCELPDRPEVTPSAKARQLLDDVLTNPEICPLARDDLTDLPPALVITCDFDVLRDEGILYAKRLEEAGVPVTLVNYENGFHAMLNFHIELFEASRSLQEIVNWSRDRILA